MVPESGMEGAAFKPSGLGVYTGNFFLVFLFHDDLHPVPTFDGLYLEWYPVWSDEASNSQQLLGPTTHTGLWDIPR